ncbi:MAG: zinc dependent phospholipase C family protein [Lachnospiraceae bacterium]
MPSTYAHKKFGALVYKKLSKNVKELIADNYECFLAGLHGPDVLFFHVPGFNRDVAAVGRRMHKQSFELMYDNATDVLIMNYDDDKMAYFMGCICHYMLDSACHPLVNAAIKETGMTHGKIEVEFDRYLMEGDGNTPFAYPAWAHLPVMSEVAQAAAPFYPEISKEDYLVALTSMKAVLMTCGTRNDSLRHALCTLMEKTGNEAKISSLLMSKQKSRMIRKNVKELKSKLVSEVDETAALIEQFSESYDKGYKAPERFQMDFNGKCPDNK